MLLLFAPYLDLSTYDPYARLRRGMSDVNAFLFSPADSSPGAALSLAAAVVVFRAGRLGARAPNYLAGAAAALPTLLLYVWGRYVDAPHLLAASLAAFCFAAALSSMNRLGLRASYPAIGLALLAIPPPAVMLHAITWPMQLATASGAGFLVDLVGLDIRHSGDILLRDGQIFEVVESCSGVRSMLILTTATLFYVGVFPRTPRSTLQLLLAAPLLAAAANFLRVLSLLFVPESHFAEAHFVQGLVVFGLGALGVALLDRGIGVPDPSYRGSVRELPAGGLAFLTSLALVLGAVALLLPRWVPPAARGPGLHDIPNRIGGFESEALDVDPDFLGTVAFSERLSRRFDRGELEVDVLVGEDDRLHPSISMLSQKALFPARGLSVLERGRFALDPDGRVVDSMRVADLGRGEWLVVYWWQGIGSRLREFLRSWFALDRGPWRREAPARLVRLTARAGHPGQAETAIRALAPALRAELARLPFGESLAQGGPR